MIIIDNYLTQEFKKQLENKRVICFCAGQSFQELCRRYQLGQKLLYVVDNYTKEETIRVAERNIPILHMSDIGDEIKGCILLITSMKYANEIIAQLDDMPLCNNQTFYIPELFGEEADYTEFEAEAPIKIPKRIHYCWFGRAKMPEIFCKNIESWKRYCSEYEIIRWDESNYDISKNRYMKRAYETKMWGFVSDYARVDIINRFGGIYLDTDVEILRSIDSLLRYNLFCGFESSRHVNFGLGFGAKNNNNVLNDILDEYERMEFCQKGGAQNLVTCPIYQTRVLEKYGLVRNGKTQIRECFIALSPEYLSPLNQYGIGRVSPRSFSIHQYAGTWIDSQKKREKDRMTENFKYIISRMEQDNGRGYMKLPWGCL